MGDIGTVVSALLILGTVFASMIVWVGGTLCVIYALFKPQKVVKDKKAKRLIVVYFINAALCGLAFRFPVAAGAVFNGVKAFFVSSTPYAEGALALAFVVFVWASPFVVIGGLIWLAFSLLASMTASEIERRQKKRQ
jgi:hypothetical protein